MDYYTGNGTEDGLTLQDMIEHDINTNHYNEHMTNTDQLQQHLEQPQPQVNGMTMLDITAMDVDGTASSTKLGDLTWLQSVNLANIQDLELRLQPENSDPNLMVDPQTGIPISQQQQQQQQQQLLTQQSTVILSGVTTTFTDSLTRQHPTPMLHSPQPQPQTQPQQQQQQRFITIPANIQQTHTFTQGQASPSAIRQQLQSQPQRTPLQQTVSYQGNTLTVQQNTHSNNTKKTIIKVDSDNQPKQFIKPVYSYSCLIAMALKNCEAGCLPVSEIYNFMTENFPYFKTAPDGWKNSVRHNLSLNKCFEKIENPKGNGTSKKGCLWGMNPAKIEKMEEEIAKWRKKDPVSLKKSMAKPEELELLERGLIGCPSPHRPAPSTTPSTPTHQPTNNNTVKVKMEALSPASIPPSSPAPMTNVNGHINIIEIKPHMQIKPEFQVKTEVKSEDSQSSVLSGLSNEDLSLLDSGLTLDPALHDLAMQVINNNGLFDDLGNDDLNLDDLPASSSPLSFTFTNGGLCASPLTLQSSAAATLSLSDTVSNYLYTNCTGQPTTTSSDSPRAFQAVRTLTAQT